MKNAARLLDICDDPALQRTFLDLSDDGRRLEGRMAASGLSARLAAATARLAGDLAPAAAHAAMAGVASLLDDGAIRALVAEELQRFASTPLYAVAARTVDSEAFSGIVLHDDALARVSLVSLGPQALRIRMARRAGNANAGVTVQGADTLVAFLRAGRARLGRWRAEPFGRDEPLATRRMARLPDLDVADGDTLFLQGGADGMSVLQCEGPLLFLLVARQVPRTPVNAHYRLDSGELQSCSASEQTSSRIQMLATLLRELDWQAGAGHLAALAGHPDHFVRWHLLRELSALSPATALPLVRRAAADDPHPQVRDAATKTLPFLDGALPCP